MRALAIRALDKAGIAWSESFVGGGVTAVVAAALAGLAVAPLARRIAPPGLVDIGPAEELPRLGSSKVMLHSKVSDPAKLAALRTLAATFRSVVAAAITLRFAGVTDHFVKKTDLSGTNSAPCAFVPVKRAVGCSGKISNSKGIYSKANAISDFWLKVLPTTRCTCWIPTGVVTSWNIGGQRIKGYAPDEIIGQHFSRFYTEADRANGKPRAPCASPGNSGRYEEEGWRVRKDGTFFWASVVIDPIYEDGKLVGFAKITRDITERREAQLKLEQMQQQLAESQKLDALGQLTGGVAHDFNNLLMIISGSLHTLKKGGRRRSQSCSARWRRSRRRPSAAPR